MIRAIAISSVVGVLIGAAATRYLWPRIEQKIQVQERVVTQTDVRTVIRTVTKPDGTKIEDKTVVDNSKSVGNKTVEKTTTKQPQYLVSAGAAYNLRSFEPEYSVSASKRILGPVFAGVTGNTTGSVGLVLTLEF